MRKLFKIELSLLIIALSFICSCKKETAMNSNLTNVSNNNELNKVGFSGSLLKFNDTRELLETIHSLSALTDSGRFEWEKQFIGFQSMSYIFELIVAEELKISDSIELDSNSDPYKHTKLISIYPNTIVTKTYEGASFFDKNIAYEPFSWIANKDGAFFIGDTLIVMDENYIRYKVNGSPNEINLMHKINESNPALGVFVEDFNSSSIEFLSDSKRSLKNGTHNFSTSCSSTNGRLKIILYQDYRQVNGRFNNSFG